MVPVSPTYPIINIKMAFVNKTKTGIFEILEVVFCVKRDLIKKIPELTTI